ncbi:ABC transporter substrate-binding protein [Litorivicinus sp.]|jgi:NitT/TauT family transport system substrate-binding protein|nr:ABC transporter substrate-binding protein [Litorivicinus sp.]|tara:strand:- start:5708 stop:6718 length:1011 start_codon:yes stop_codon:yes gene_type:complete
MIRKKQEITLMFRLPKTLLMLTLACGLILTSFSQTVEATSLKLAALKFGTVKWELQTIKDLGLDRKNGFELEVIDVAGKQGSSLSIQNDAVDVIVTDWLWVANQRSKGQQYQFFPYSKAVGGMLVANKSPINSLEDLKGKRIGIAGGPLDKSWIIIQAIGKKRHGLDLAKSNELVFGAPPLLFKQAMNGEIDAVINFWHYLAKLEAKGFRKVIDVQEAAGELGLSADTPLLGYVFKEAWAKANPQAVAGLYAASREAKSILATDDLAWEKLKTLMKPKSQEEFIALRDAWRTGVPGQAIDYSSAESMFAFMKQYGEGKLIKKDSSLDAGAFFAIKK